jgi:hypothetical protein
MQIQRVNRTDPEKVFLNLKNGTATVISTGMGVRLLGPVADAEIVSSDGTQVIALDSAAYMYCFMGIANKDIASLGYGRVQAWGFVDSIMLSMEADKTIGIVSFAETILKKGGGAGNWTSAGVATLQAMSTQFYKYVHVLSTTNISGGIPYAKGFVRAL